jgi:tetratricopeptide (TPR) repeat protein
LTKKEKLIDSAQKNLQKGQIAKAIKDYQQLIELEPKDIRHRQKLAELYNRAQMTEQALEEFHKVGNYYADNGFFLKAIAVFKQIQRICPTDLKIYGRLAELNVKQGLIGNALAEYRNLIAYHEKQGQTEEVIAVLQKMKSIDPENLNIRVKLAETFAAGGMKNEALEDFQEVLKVLQAKNDQVKIIKLHELFGRFFPDEPLLKAGLGLVLIHQGEAAKGVAMLEPLLALTPDDPTLLRSLATGYRRLGVHDREQSLYARLVARLPGDLELRERLARACLDAGAFAQALQVLEEAKSALLEAGRLANLKECYVLLRDRLPDEERVNATLQTIYEISGEGAKLFDAMAADALPAVEVAPAVEPDEPPLDFSVAPEQSIVASAPAVFPVAEESEEIDLEFLESLEGGELPESLVEPAADVPLVLDLPGGDVFADLGAEPVGAAPEPAPSAAGAALVPFDLDNEELSLSFDEESPPAPEGPAMLDGLPNFDLTSASTVAEFPEVAAPGILEKVEEAGFLVIQGRFAEAERLCRELLTTDPACRPAEDLLADIRSRRTSEPPAADSGEDFFNFSAEVMAELDDAVALPAATPAASKKDRYGMEGVFSEFKKGVREQIESDDVESHFNLGIAYKEMGLLDDAIGEFDQAMRDPSRRLDCLTLKGLCLVEKQDFAGAEMVLKQGLAIPGLTEVQRVSLFYDLGLVYESWKRPLDALDSFQSVADADMFYRNVQEKILDLRRQLGMEGGGEDDSEGNAGGKDRVSYI